MRVARTLEDNQVEFIEHPQDSYLSGSLPVLVECVVRHAGQSFIECNNRMRSDVTRNISLIGGVKHEKLSLLVYRKDFESDDLGFQEASEKLLCQCVAYSHVTHQKVTSDLAVITNSCKKSL